MGAQGSPLTPEYKRAIVCVKKYFDRTKGDLEEQERDSVERTANALEVGMATVKRVMADYNRNPDLLDEESLRRGHPLQNGLANNFYPIFLRIRLLLWITHLITMHYLSIQLLQGLAKKTIFLVG
jgi:hypothetical protein